MSGLASTSEKVKFSVIGSCVSRDVLSFVGLDVIGQYLARASLASIASPASRWAASLPLEFKENTNDWYKKVAQADIKKTHRDQIDLMTGGYVLIDLIEERAEIVDCGFGSYLTRSQVLSSLTNFDAISDKKRIRILSNEGFSIWAGALPAFVDILSSKVPIRDVIIHRALYAGGPESEKKNQFLRRMYDELQRVLPDAGVVEVAGDAFAPEPNHKWGAAPFHYRDDYYVEVVRQLQCITGANLPLRAGFSLCKTAITPPR